MKFLQQLQAILERPADTGHPDVVLLSLTRAEYDQLRRDVATCQSCGPSTLVQLQEPPPRPVEVIDRRPVAHCPV